MSKFKKVRLSDYVAKRCQLEDISDVFLVTGGGSMHLNDAFARNPDLSITCFHHEQSASMAADGYYRVNNKPVVLNLTTGPGCLNALNGVHGAYVDSLALIIISGQVKRETLQTNQKLPMRQLGDQEVDIISVIKPMVKYAVRVEDPDSIKTVLDKAFWIAKNGRPGPVWIDIPIDVQATYIDYPQEFGETINYTEVRHDACVTDNTKQELDSLFISPSNLHLDQILEHLALARKPVILAGTGVRISGMYKAFHELINLLGIPVVTGWNAHDLVRTNHQFFAGKPGTQGDRAGNFTVQNADFLLILGCRLNIRQISYNWKNFAKGAFKVMVDADKGELEKTTLQIDLKINALLQDFIPSFLSSLNNYVRPVIHKNYLEWCLTRLDKYTVGPKEGFEKTGYNINPYSFLYYFFDDLKCGDTVVTANGSACVMGFQVAKIKENQRVFTNSGSASMGYDLPASIGASIATKKGIVFCIAGDGSIMMNLQELQTIVTYELPIKIILLNNSGYASIRQTQRNYFPDNIFGTGTKGDGLNFPDFSAVANTFGIRSLTIKSMSEYWSNDTRELLEEKKPALLNVIVDADQPFEPKLISKKMSDGTMYTPSLEDMAPFLTREELMENIYDND